MKKDNEDVEFEEGEISPENGYNVLAAGDPGESMLENVIGVSSKNPRQSKQLRLLMRKFPEL